MRVETARPHCVLFENNVLFGFKSLTTRRLLQHSGISLEGLEDLME